LKNGRNSGFIYWKLNYRKKFIRTLWHIPISIIAIIVLLTSEIPELEKKIWILALLISLPAQLVYTYFKRRNEIQQEE
jgi:choline-glycine betaine transporter